jgi:hypothetical protein
MFSQEGALLDADQLQSDAAVTPIWPVPPEAGSEMLVVEGVALQAVLAETTERGPEVSRALKEPSWAPGAIPKEIRNRAVAAYLNGIELRIPPEG